MAEEVTQEAFFKTLRPIDSFDGSKDIRTWLFTIAKNTYFLYHKKIEIKFTMIHLMIYLIRESLYQNALNIKHKVLKLI